MLNGFSNYIGKISIGDIVGVKYRYKTHKTITSRTGFPKDTDLLNQFVLEKNLLKFPKKRFHFNVSEEHFYKIKALLSESRYES